MFIGARYKVFEKTKRSEPKIKKIAFRKNMFSDVSKKRSVSCLDSLHPGTGAADPG
jgi:hypothetical protein